MESIRGFPEYVSSGEAVSGRRGVLPAWLGGNAAGIGWMIAAAMSCVLAVLWPAAALLAVLAGAMVGWIGRRLRWRAAVGGDAGRMLADFRVVNGTVECRFREDVVRRYGRSQMWRVAAALVAGMVCLAVQHLHWMNPIDLAGSRHWLAAGGEFCSFLLPLACGALFLSARGADATDREKLKAAIQSRAADAVTGMMRAAEIDGLEAGIAGLYRQLDLWWAGEYRSAIDKWIESHTAEAIFEPESGAAFVKTVTDLARTDLNRLAEAAESFRSVECRLYALEALTRTSGEPQPDFARLAGRSADELRSLAIAKRWEQLSQRAARMVAELDDLLMEFRLRARSAVTLPPEADPYRILGAEASASTAAIKKLRLRLAQVYHPDIGGETSNDAKMAELNAAYDAVMRGRNAPSES